MARFNFVGTLSHGDNYLRTGDTKSGLPYCSINMSVVAAQNNRAYIEAFGMLQNTIKTMDVDNNRIEVSYKDAKDADVIANVANYRKHIVSIDGDRHEFISDYDFVKFLADNIDVLNNKKVQVTGQINKNIYEGKISDRFAIQNIYTVDDERKNGLTVTSEVYFNKDSFDFTDWKSEKKVIINGYESAYIDKDNGTKFVPRQVVLDASKVNLDNEKHVKLLEFRLKHLKCVLENGMVKCGLKKNDYYSINMQLSYQNGAEEVEFDESSLTKAQKEQIELGLKSIEDFKPAGGVFGERVIVLKIKDYDLRGKYEDGAIKYEDDFEDEIYMIEAPKTMEELVKEIESYDNEDDLAGLFD